MALFLALSRWLCYNNSVISGTAPITKNGESHSSARGMTPIEKNIIVIDENGNELEATYPKRAKGLVKKGRARFLDENTICLACPPDILEDTEMTDEKIFEDTAQTPTADKYNLNYVLEQIEKLAVQTDYVMSVIGELRQMETGGDSGVVDMAGAQKAEALSDVVKCRETTNQQLLRFYEKMYDDLKPKPQTVREKALGFVESAMNHPTLDVNEKGLLADMLETVERILDNVRNIGE